MHFKEKSLRKSVVFSIFFYFLILHLQAQRDTFYVAQFSGSGQTTGNNWVATGRNACMGDGFEFFGTRNGVFELTNFDGDNGNGCPSGIALGDQPGANNSTWIATVDISQFCDVEFTVSLSGAGNFENTSGIGRDGLVIDYQSLGSDNIGGSGDIIGNLSNSSLTYSNGVINGETLIITITFGTQSSDESIFINRVQISGQPILSCPSCSVVSDDYNIPNTISNTQTVRVRKNIFATQLIESTADVTFTAGTSINLQPGFKVQNGAIFHAFIGSCTLPNFKQVETRNAPSTLVNQDKLQVQISPNPLQNDVNIQLYLPESSNVTSVITDLNGRTLHVREDLDVRQGWQQIKFEVGNLPPGIYFSMVRANDQQVIQPIVVIK